MPEAVLDVVDAIRGTTLPLARVLFYHPDETDPLEWAGVGITDLTTGRYTEARVLALGDLVEQLSDGRGQSQDNTCTITLSDLPDAITGEMRLRGFLGDPATLALLGVQIVVQLTTETDLQAGHTWITLFRGLVRAYDMPSGYLFTLECESWLAPRKASQAITRTALDAFPNCPIANRSRIAPYWYGAQTDEGSDENPPTIFNEAGNGSSGPTSGFHEAGVGNRAGTIPTTFVATNSGSGGTVPAGAYNASLQFKPTGGSWSERTPLITGQAVTVGAGEKLTWTSDNMGTGTYRLLIGDGADWRRIVRYVDAATNSGEWDGANHLPGGDHWIHQYVCWEEFANGRTVINLNPVISVGVGDKQIIRFAFTKHPAAMRGGVAIKLALGPYFLEWVVTATVTVATVDYWLFENDQSPAFYATGTPIPDLQTPKGVVPFFHVGEFSDLNGNTWQGFAGAGTAIAGNYGSLFVRTGATVERVSDLLIGFDIAVPGKTNFATWFGAIDYRVGADGSRWSLIYILGSSGYITGLLDGSATLYANLDGIEDVGDGSGALIDDFDDQVAHLLDNVVLDAEVLGNWRTIVPQWADKTSKRDEPSFLEAQAIAALLLSASKTTAWGVTSAVTVGELMARLANSGGNTAYADTADGLRWTRLDPEGAAVATLTERDDIHLGGFSGRDDRLGYANQVPFAFAPAYAADGAVTLAQTDVIEDLVSQAQFARLGKVPTSVLELYARPFAAAAQQVAELDLAQSAVPPRLAPLTGGLHLLHRKVGEIVAVDHREGMTATGWTGHRVQIRAKRLSPDLCTCMLTVLDIPARFSLAEVEELHADLDLGGSWYHSPALTAADPQTVQAYEWRARQVRWNVIPFVASVKIYLNAKVEVGTITLTPIIWNRTNNIEAVRGSAVSATSFQQQVIDLPRPIDDKPKDYDLRAEIAGADSTRAVQFLASIRTFIGAAPLAGSSVDVDDEALTEDASDQAVTLDCDVDSGGSPVPSGAVTFRVFNGATLIGTETTDTAPTAGHFSVSYTIPGGTAAGSYTIQASYSGTSAIAASVGAGALTISVATATRLYLSSTAAGYAPPTFRGSWDDTAPSVTKALTHKVDSANATATATVNLTVTDHDVLLYRGVSVPLAAQTIAGTIDTAVSGHVGPFPTAWYWHVHIFVTVGDTDVVRGTLLTNYIESGSNEWPSGGDFGVQLAAAQALAALAITAGDRVVVEIGARLSTYTAWVVGTTVHHGYGVVAGGADAYPDGGSGLNSWIEFSHDLVEL